MSFSLSHILFTLNFALIKLKMLMEQKIYSDGQWTMFIFLKFQFVYKTKIHQVNYDCSCCEIQWSIVWRKKKEKKEKPSKISGLSRLYNISHVGTRVSKSTVSVSMSKSCLILSLVLIVGRFFVPWTFFIETKILFNLLSELSANRKSSIFFSFFVLLWFWRMQKNSYKQNKSRAWL